MMIQRMMSLALALGLTGFAQAQDAARVDKPVMKVGDMRSYVVRDAISRGVTGEVSLTVETLTPESLVMRDSGQPQAVMFNGEFGMLNSGVVQYSSPFQLLQFPLEVGRTWTHKPAYVHERCGDTVSELKSTVVGWEDVTVPAGSFRALRIDSDGRYRNGCGSDRQNFKFWYAPNVKWLVRSEIWIYGGGRPREAQIRELTAFKLVD